MAAAATVSSFFFACLQSMKSSHAALSNWKARLKAIMLVNESECIWPLMSAAVSSDAPLSTSMSMRREVCTLHEGVVPASRRVEPTRSCTPL